MTGIVRLRSTAEISMLAGSILVAAATSAPAQTSPYVGDWTGYWDSSPNGYVEYRIMKAKGKVVPVDYVYKTSSGNPVHKLIRCNAVSDTELNCGASSITFSSASTAEATMHATNGATPTAALTK